jgi:hypothetical protein
MLPVLCVNGFGVALDLNRNRHMREAQQQVHQPLLLLVELCQRRAIETGQTRRQQILAGVVKRQALRLGTIATKPVAIGGAGHRPVRREWLQSLETGR